MKTYRNLFDKICSCENLLLAFYKARKNKSKKSYVIEFARNLEENLLKLHGELVNGTYHPLPLKTFILRDPKTRRISVSDFRDRIVHHAICNILEPILEKYFIYDSYANRKGKGTLAAVNRFDVFKRKVSENGLIIKGKKDSNQVRGFVFKADIRHYFEEVDHDKLIEVIAKRISDQESLDLIKKIICNYDAKNKGKGVPLGNLTSQFFANVYLNELDQYVKHTFRAKYYIRYVDDFVILHQSKQQLQEWKEQIANFLKSKLFLELHPHKSKIVPLGQGVDLLGFRCFYHFRLPRKGNIEKMKKKLACFRKLKESGELNRIEVIECFKGWNAYAMHANSFKLRRKMAKEILEIIRH